MEIAIEKKISDTAKEIYSFVGYSDGTWHYRGIMFSNRDGKGDKWGEKWGDKEKEKEILDFAKKLASEFNYDLDERSDKELLEIFDEYWSDETDVEEELQAINYKWNPVCNKTINGEIRYHGTYGGTNGPEIKPKMTEEEIAEAIKDKLTKKIKVIIK